MNSLTIAARSNQGHRESFRGPGQYVCSDCFNRVLDCSIRVYRSFGAHKQSRTQGKMPQSPPSPLSAELDLTPNTSARVCLAWGGLARNSRIVGCLLDITNNHVITIYTFKKCTLNDRGCASTRSTRGLYAPVKSLWSRRYLLLRLLQV